MSKSLLKSILRPVETVLGYITWLVLILVSFIGFFFEEGVGFYDILFWLGMAVVSIQNSLSKVNLVKVVEDE